VISKILLLYLLTYYKFLTLYQVKREEKTFGPIREIIDLALLKETIENKYLEKASKLYKMH